jgi:hypothetical protein
VVAIIGYLQKVGAYQVVEAPGNPQGRPLDPDSYRRGRKSEAKN